MTGEKKKKAPNLAEEKKLWQRGYRAVVGLDEVGRGPLAGPVTAAAVTVRQFPISNVELRARKAQWATGLYWGNHVALRNFQRKVAWQPRCFTQFPKKSKTPNPRTLNKIRDSKKLTVEQRERWYEFLTTHPDIKWGIGSVSEKIIDRINILAATKLAMKKALEDLGKKGVQAEYLLLDGNFLLEGSALSQKAVVRGDEKIWSCAAASVIAKVTRDRLMQKYHQKYPRYGFARHKGYGTLTHRQAVRQYGPCEIHRRSFRGIR
ncbi:MAG: ribonuclease HII [Patescibacteria group bacterium]